MQGDVVDHDVAELDEDLGAQWLCERVRDHVGRVRGDDCPGGSRGA